MKKQNKWLDNFGKADNANESNVSLPEDFNGLAYDTTGRNYSPAWGGQFQTGGTLPGSPGFTYARTGSTPSNGKYAKKTLPSAQYGIQSPLLMMTKIAEMMGYGEKNNKTVPVEKISKEVDTYQPGLTDKLLLRQAYKESTFNPKAVSPKGYKGLAQVGEDVLKDYMKKKENKKLDPFNPDDAVQLQKFAMEDLYNSSFINKPNQSDSVRIAKTLAAYNWGRGNLFDYLGEQKKKGVDIYNSYDWLKDLPKETSDYVNKILLQEDESFNKNYQKAISNPKYKNITGLYETKEFGGEIPSAQNGQEMKFYQEGLDWKPKSMKDGGEQPIRVSTTDPRYPELYKNRQVGSWSPQYEAYNLPDLPEVTVTGKDESLKEAMYQGSNRFLQNAFGVLGSSQTVPMELLTGKQQTPSQAWGFNTEGLSWYHPKSISNFAMDAALDPLNAFGVGIADDLTRNIIRQEFKKSPKLTPSLGDINKNFKISDNFYEIIDSPEYRELKQFDPDYANLINEQVKSGNNWLKNWISNPATQKRIQELNFNKDPKVNQNIEDFISGKNVVKGDVNPFNFSGLEAGIYKPSKNRATVDVMNPVFLEGKMSIPSTTVHEGTHLLSRGDLAYGNESNNLVRDIFASDDFLYHLTKESAGRSKMFHTPEVHARIMQLRKQYGILPDQEVSKELINKIVEDGLSSKTSVDPSFFKMIQDKDAFKKAFNKLPAIIPITGLTLTQLENQNQVPEMELGGVIKDNRGQWDHPGEITEIDSPYITMQGVPYDVLGVSDTGDTKLMKPGKDYKFKGKKVTEYPIAKLGINDLDAQPKKKLNQLLNFTNNPDKNWLKKYE